ncbi:hypothetical protein [Mycobacterium sherrisii]|uniref:hypothetical protein n=1 Tax=Mycobacterium sherrisii TaxID=243061 RepID=UPI000AEC263B|nr:hypothetical protein [Mycobacterium sherrisii]
MEFVYVALVIDCYSRAIVGWQVSTTKDTAMVTHGVEDGHATPRPLRSHHSQGIDPPQRRQFSLHIDLLRRNPSSERDRAYVGSIGDAYDNALAQTTIGLF